VCSLTNKLVKYLPSVELQALLEQHRKEGTVGDTLLVLQVQNQPARAWCAVYGVNYILSAVSSSQHAPVFTVGKRGSTQDFHTDPQVGLSCSLLMASHFRLVPA
jgi:lipoate-protein ligase B